MKAKKIMKVLKFLKEYCENISCNDCLLGKGYYSCPLHQAPYDYDIKGIKKNLNKMEE